MRSLPRGHPGVKGRVTLLNRAAYEQCSTHISPGIQSIPAWGVRASTDSGPMIQSGRAMTVPLAGSLILPHITREVKFNLPRARYQSDICKSNVNDGEMSRFYAHPV